MLEVRNIQTYYGNIQALKNVSLTINEGEIVTLIGANGAGKSTTLMSISGVTPPRNGEILFRGQPIQGLGAVDHGLVAGAVDRNVFCEHVHRHDLAAVPIRCKRYKHQELFGIHGR